MMRFNISQLEAFVECEQKWAYIYKHKRGVPEKSQALIHGLAWHALMEMEPIWLIDNNDNPTPPMRISQFSHDQPLWMNKGYEAWLEWKKDKPFEIVARELVLEAPIGFGMTLFGRLDGLIRWDGRLWSLQHKTLDPSVPVGTFQRLVARSWHEHAYRHLIEHAYSEEYMERFATTPYMGVLLVICRKFIDKTILRGQSPLCPEFIPLSPDHDEIMRSITTAARTMAIPAPPSRITRVCAGPRRNSLCPYVDVCEGFKRIEEMGEIDPFEGYKVKHEDESEKVRSANP